MKEGEDYISEEDEYQVETEFVIKTINFEIPKITQKLIEQLNEEQSKDYIQSKQL